MNRGRPGYLMVDVLLAVAILGLSAVALIVLLRQTLASVSQASGRARDVMAAAPVLASAVARDRNWLATHGGLSRYEGWTLDVEQSDGGLTRLRLRDTLWNHEVLRTVVYRSMAEDSSAQR